MVRIVIFLPINRINKHKRKENLSVLFFPFSPFFDSRGQRAHPSTLFVYFSISTIVTKRACAQLDCALDYHWILQLQSPSNRVHCRPSLLLFFSSLFIFLLVSYLPSFSYVVVDTISSDCVRFIFSFLFFFLLFSSSLFSRFLVLFFLFYFSFL